MSTKNELLEYYQETYNEYSEEFIKVYTEYFMTIYRIWSEVHFEGNLEKIINRARANAVESIVSADSKVDDMLWSLYTKKSSLLSSRNRIILGRAWHNARKAMLAEHEVLINSIKSN